MGNNSNNNNNRNRSAIIRNGQKISGHKRNKPESSDNESSGDEESSDEESSSDNNDNHQNSNNHNRNNNNNNTQLSQLQSQSRKRRKIAYPNAPPEKWKQQCSKKQRRSTRIKYRKLAEQTQTNRAMIVDPMQPHYIDTLKKQQQIYGGVCHPNEAFMDIEQANSMSKILKEQTRSLANEQFTINTTDYIAAIIQQFPQQNASQNDTEDSDDEDEPKKVDWTRIGHHFASWFLSVPPIQFMNGPLQQCEVQTEVQKKRGSHAKKRKFQ